MSNLRFIVSRKTHEPPTLSFSTSLYTVAHDDCILGEHAGQYAQRPSMDPQPFRTGHLVKGSPALTPPHSISPLLLSHSACLNLPVWWRSFFRNWHMFKQMAKICIQALGSTESQHRLCFLTNILFFRLDFFLMVLLSCSVYCRHLHTF